MKELYIVVLDYVCDHSTIDSHKDAHIEFLKEYYAKGYFLASGPRIPRTGGVILAKAKNIEELRTIFKEDPFLRHELATYEIIEFTPTLLSEEMSKLPGI